MNRDPNEYAVPRLIALLAVSLVVSSASAASAQLDPVLPVAFAERPLTLPQGVVSADGGLMIERFPGLFGGSADTATFMELRAALGITDAIEVGVSPLIMVLEPDAEVSAVALQFAAHGASGPVQFGFAGEAFIGVNDNDLRILTFGVPLRIQAGKLRLDTGFNMSVLFGIGDELALFNGRPQLYRVPLNDSGIPFSLTASLAPWAYLGISTGFYGGEFDALGDDAWAIPLGFHVGGTVGQEDVALADLSAAFELPNFYSGLRGETFTEHWQLRFVANVYFRAYR